MQIKEKKVRKFLSKKIQQLNNIVADLDSIVTEIGSDYFRVSIFGSARIKKSTDEYIQVYNLAKKLAQNKADIVTGGGPGLMEAANAGAKDGESKSADLGTAAATSADSQEALGASVDYAVASGVTAVIGYSSEDRADEGTATKDQSGSAWYVGATVSF